MILDGYSKSGGTPGCIFEQVKSSSIEASGVQLTSHIFRHESADRSLPRIVDITLDQRPRGSTRLLFFRFLSLSQEDPPRKSRVQSNYLAAGIEDRAGDQGVRAQGVRSGERSDKVYRYRKKTKRPAAVCVTVPHRALTARRRVASLKSCLAPTCSTEADADWSPPPATPAIGTPIELSENFPRYIVRRTSPTPTRLDRGPHVGRKVGFAGDPRKGETSGQRRHLRRVHENIFGLHWTPGGPHPPAARSFINWPREHGKIRGRRTCRPGRGLIVDRNAGNCATLCSDTYLGSGVHHCAFLACSRSFSFFSAKSLDLELILHNGRRINDCARVEKSPRLTADARIRMLFIEVRLFITCYRSCGSLI
ncbi:hypothetical protein KM043_006759 [Ampulex compressa]|nr:hypothetical protein KM043_006759 [Ampulex compressa]